MRSEPVHEVLRWPYQIPGRFLVLGILTFGGLALVGGHKLIHSGPFGWALLALLCLLTGWTSALSWRLWRNGPAQLSLSSTQLQLPEGVFLHKNRPLPLRALKAARFVGHRRARAAQTREVIYLIDHQDQSKMIVSELFTYHQDYLAFRRALCQLLEARAILIEVDGGAGVEEEVAKQP